MDPETEKIIKEQMGKLPDEIRNLFTEPELGNKILNIGKKNGIVNIEQLGTFQTETNLMMLGLVHPDEYPNELKNQLKIDDMKVDNIVNDINTQILSGIREKLKEVYEKTDETLDTIKESEEPSLKNLETREEMLKTIETPDLFAEKELPAPQKEEEHPILAQKLSGSFQIPTTETNHFLKNIQPSSPQKGMIGKSVDPYREPTE